MSLKSAGFRVVASLLAVAALVAVFVLAGGDDEDESGGAGVGPVSGETEATTTGEGPTTTTEREPKPAGPEVAEIVVSGGEPKGGVAELSYEKGDRVDLLVRSDVADEVHVHGYDLSEEVEAGGKARFRFTADLDGIYEVELERSGVQLAELRIR